MKITILKNFPAGTIKPSHRKEKNFSKQITAFDKENNEIIICRFYESAMTVFCCLWFHATGMHFCGSGKATGYGFDHYSSALWAALQAAGVNITELDSTNRIDEALNLLANHFEVKLHFIHEAHA